MHLPAYPLLRVAVVYWRYEPAASATPMLLTIEDLSMSINPYESPKSITAPWWWRLSVSHCSGSLWGAIALLCFDVVLSGSFLISFFACPIWFLASGARNAIQRPGWRVALDRIALPVLTLGIVLGINASEWKIAHANAERIVMACEEFHAVNGYYPKALDELVPRYLPAIPRAKHCLIWGEFLYWHFGQTDDPEHFLLVWVKIPPFGRETYSSRDHRWGYLD